MENDKTISSIYNNLNEIRAKIQFLNGVNLSHQEALLSGHLVLESDFIHGQTLINCELETAFENALKDLEKFC